MAQAAADTDRDAHAARTRRRARRRLDRYLQEPGNWRFKGLLLAAFGDAAAVGRAWPTSPERRRALQARVPAGGVTPPATSTVGRALAGDTNESAHARTLADDVDGLADGRADRDRYIARALVTATETELDVLWREELLDTVLAGAAPRKAAREVSTVDPVDARKGDLPTFLDQPYAGPAGEAAEASLVGEAFKQTSYSCVKREQGFGVTDELLDFAEPALIEANVRRAGEAVENAINRRYINHLIDNGTTYDADLSGAGNTDLRDLLLKASEKAADNDFDPTDVVAMHPEFASELFGNNQLAGIDGLVTDAVETSVGGPVGHQPAIVSGSAYDSGTNTYGFESDGEFGALVYGRRYVRIPMYRDVTTTEIQEDPIRDIQRGVARAIFDVTDVENTGGTSAVVRVQR